jgi:two-component system, OmpR family, sensor histidine kinase KdpD
MARGTLRIYLGAAPGVGKTFAMLNEGRRRHDRGTDVVVGFVETHGRAKTADQIADLEVVPRRRLEYRGSTFEEMDVDAILARHPAQALVDEFAHTNVPGSRNEKRWRDVEELLNAGIDVISTLNIQHLESVNDVVERITGVAQRETIPDAIARKADQLELVDMSPEALRRRMAHGNVYQPEKIDAALANYFRLGNLAALRELALLWVADRVDEALEEYRERHGITEPWETRERVLVAITGAPSTEALIRRAARMAQRAHGELLGLHVSTADGLAGPRSDNLARHQELLADLGGEYHETVANDVAAALAEFARAENCTQLVLGASRRSRWTELVRGSVINRAVRLAVPIDVHVISHEAEDSEQALPPRRPYVAWRSPLSRRRQLSGWLLAAIGLPLLTSLLVHVRSDVGLETVLLLFLSLVVAVGAVGGVLPGLAAAIVGFLLVNWYFTPPTHTWTVADGENFVALVVFVVVSAVVSGLVDLAARQALEGKRARAEAETLARLTADASSADPLHALVSSLRSAFRLRAVAVMSRTDGTWNVEAADGDPIPTSPDEVDLVEEIGPGVLLVLDGPTLSADDRQVLNAFATQLAAVRERARLSEAAASASALGQTNELRAALLQAVSHDLRTPLSSIKAAASSMRQPDVEWSAADVAEFLATIEDEADRLNALVGNLLDMSRLQAGVIEPMVRVVHLEEVVPAALAGLGDRARSVETDVSESLPPVQGDAALLERVIANLVENALKWSPPETPVRVEAGAVKDRVSLRVVDRGPGIRAAERDRVFLPFQRLGDAPGDTGVGLGLAVAVGFVNAMEGELELDDTPGGGTTVTVTLKRAS